MKNTKFFIVGAGFAGQMLYRDIERKKVFGKVMAFLDDDERLIGTKIEGLPVLGPLDNTLSLLDPDMSCEAIIALPGTRAAKISNVYKVLKTCGFTRIRILPNVRQIIEADKAFFLQTRAIDPLDLLGRDPVKISLKESLSYLNGHRVLITGAGGSIGSELARQLLTGGAERLYLLGHGENSIYQIDRELRLLQKEGIGLKATIVPIIGDIKDVNYCHYILKATKCDVVFHCAAYKHVPMTEENPISAIENNVFGTKNILDAALQARTRRFVLISTDKAVEPISVYGISKLLCEKLVLEASAKVQDGQKFMFVRFGNVLGSRGSILPLFMEQIRLGEDLTVTHKDMRRFFMTIPEACSLVLKTGGVGENGKSYLLDMGAPIRIVELAEQAIRFSGLEPYKDLGIKFIGLRPGERLDEPLWKEEERPKPTKYPKILELQSLKCDFDLEVLLSALRPICIGPIGAVYRDRKALIDALCLAFPYLVRYYDAKGYRK